MRLLIEILVVFLAGAIGFWVGRGERDASPDARWAPPPLPRHWPTLDDLHREGNREWNSAVEMAARQVEIWPHGRQTIRNAIATHLRTYKRVPPAAGVVVPPPSDSEKLAC